MIILGAILILAVLTADMRKCDSAAELVRESRKSAPADDELIMPEITV